MLRNMRDWLCNCYRNEFNNGFNGNGGILWKVLSGAYRADVKRVG